MSDVYQNMKEKGIVLPAPPAKGGVYSPVISFSGNLVYCSGCGCDLGDGNSVMGKLGEGVSIEEGQKAAYNCVLNLLANLDKQLGDLNRIKRFVKMLAFVNSTDSFDKQPLVVDGGSQLLLDIFGSEAGLPARSAIGCNTLPGGIACEIEVLLEIVR
ncbi:MAG TPA: RidA family protein [Clostridiales bacterium]|nr:RidA family protein [Clostridiales bacterium]